MLDRAGLIARVESGSYAPKPGDPAHGLMVFALDDPFDRYAQVGAVKIVCRTRILFGRAR